MITFKNNTLWLNVVYGGNASKLLTACLKIKHTYLSFSENAEKKQQIQSSVGSQNGRYDSAHKFPGCTVFKYQLRSGDEKD